MKRFLCIFAMGLCWLFSSVFLAHLWVKNAEIFPKIPELIWEWADSFYQSTNGEELASLEFLGVFVVSSLFLALIGLLVYFFFRGKS